MKEPFADILSLEGVHGVLVLSSGAEVLYDRFYSADVRLPKDAEWRALVSLLDRINEVDVLYETLRLYLRRTDSGHLVVVADPGASGAMLRLNCDILLPSLKQLGGGGKLKRFFKKSPN